MAGKAAPKLVGLDIGASGIRAVELKRDRKSGAYTIVKAASVDLPRGAVRNGVIAEPDDRDQEPQASCGARAASRRARSPSAWPTAAC